MSFFSCFNDNNNNPQALLYVSTNLIKHTVETSFCCDIYFLISSVILILKKYLSINKIVLT